MVFLTVLFLSAINTALASFYANCAYRLQHIVTNTTSSKKKQKSLHELKLLTVPIKYWQLFLRPSHCHKCKKHILIRDNIPIISFFLLGGRCRFCNHKIPLWIWLCEIYPVLLTLLLFFSELSLVTLFLQSILLTVLAGHLYIHIATDFGKFYLSPINSGFILIWSILYGLLYHYTTEKINVYPNYQDDSLLLRLLFSGGIFIVMTVLYIIGLRKQSLGLGDVLLAPIFFIQLPPLFSLFTIQLGALMAIVWVLLKIRQKKRFPKNHHRKQSWNLLRSIPAPLGGCLCLANLLIILLMQILIMITT